MEILHRTNDTKIAKGTTDLGKDCFNQINNLKNHATYSSHHKITPDIAVPKTGQKKKNKSMLVFSVWLVCFGRYGSVSLVG